VIAPFILLVAFRHIFHPLAEFVTFSTVDFGTAHLWFILTIGYAIHRDITINRCIYM